MEKQNIPSTITLKKDKVAAHHINDGSELISSEIQASTLKEISKCLNRSLKEGYVIDDEGIIKSVMLFWEQELPYLWRSRYPLHLQLHWLTPS